MLNQKTTHTLRRVQHVLNGLPADAVLVANAGVWAQAIDTVLNDCARYAQGLTGAETWCSAVTGEVGVAAQEEYQARLCAQRPSDECQLSVATLAQLWHHAIVHDHVSREANYTRKVIIRQRYCIEHDLSVLCIAPPLIDGLLQERVEQQYPGVLAMAKTLMLLDDDPNSRRRTMQAWQEAQRRLPDVAIDTLGPLTPLD